MQHHHTDSMSAERLQLFTAGLSGMAPQEVRKAKLLYLRNAISEYQATKASLEGFGQRNGCLSILPLFGSVIRMQRQTIDAQIQLRKDRILNAIDVWRDDLKGEKFILDGEEIEV